jgi:urea carboxylase
MPGRVLRVGDVLHIATQHKRLIQPFACTAFGARIDPSLYESMGNRCIDTDRTARPISFTEADIEHFFAAEWKVHHNSSRTGIRLIGPKPQWARSRWRRSRLASIQYSR